jgi:hypothetical protein
MVAFGLFEHYSNIMQCHGQIPLCNLLHGVSDGHVSNIAKAGTRANPTGKTNG